MERPIDLRLHRLNLARSKAIAQNPVDITLVAELNAEIQRHELGRPSPVLDPVTQAFYNYIVTEDRIRKNKNDGPPEDKPPYEHLLQ